MDLCGVGDCHLNLHARLDVDGGDLLDDLRGRVQVNDTLVNPHLELVPGLRTLTARSLPGSDPVDWRLLLNSLSILVCSHDFGRVSDWSDVTSAEPEHLLRSVIKLYPSSTPFP